MRGLLSKVHLLQHAVPDVPHNGGQRDARELRVDELKYPAGVVNSSRQIDPTVHTHISDRSDKEQEVELLIQRPFELQ